MDGQFIGISSSFNAMFLRNKLKAANKTRQYRIHYYTQMKSVLEVSFLTLNCTNTPDDNSSQIVSKLAGYPSNSFF